MISDILFEINIILTDCLENYSGEPFDYDKPVIAEVEDIRKRIQLLQSKLDDPQFNGSYHYEGK